MINYIQILNREIKINNKTVIQKTFEQYLNSLLIKDLTTYKGRIDAIRIKYNYRKLIPIYICEDLCLIPIENKKSIDNLYLNIYSIKYIDITSNIIFNDNTIIKLDKKYHIIKKYIKRALTIKKEDINI